MKTIDPHGGARIDVPATEVQDPKVHLLRPQFISEGKHVRRRTTEPIKSRDDQRVTRVDRLKCFVELRASGVSAADTVVDVEVITTNTGGEQVRNLPVGVLRTRRHSRIANQLAHATPHHRRP